MPYEGDYHCYFSRQGVEEPRASCRIARAAGGALRLVGTNASTRIDGSLHPLDHRSFRFDGALVTAPEGEVIQTSGPFEAVDVQVYRGPLPTPRGPIWVTVAYVPRPGPRGVVLP
ncbi:MAG TPA: hypothetical protein VFS43_32165 [Polyangiaceae bacterium]|nr:hypothetical protein [Polyangiaceae bacterium]